MFKLILSLVIIPSLVWADLKQKELISEMKSKLELLPEKALTVDFLTAKAMENSDSFKTIMSERPRAESFSYLGQAPLDWQVTTGYQFYHSRLEQSNSFSPQTQKVETLSVGVKKLLKTNTAFSLDLAQSKNQWAFATASSMPTPFYQDTYQLSLAQGLWKDSFGIGLRAGIDALEKQKQAHLAQIETLEQNWFYALVQNIYQAKLLQEKVQAYEENLKRRESLLNITHIRIKRGTAEKPDLLQIESSVALAQMALSLQQQQLSDIWRNLILTVGLPEKWQALNPIFVPLKVDAPINRAKEICQNFSLTNSSPAITYNQFKKESAYLNLKKAKSELAPDLKLIASAKVNGIDANKKMSEKEATGRDHPEYILGVTLSMPLELSLEKANIAEGLANEMRASAEESQIKQRIQIDHTNLCAQLDRLMVTQQILSENIKRQELRVRLEKERFNLGRVSLNNYIFAEDDAMNAKLQLNENLMEQKITAWKIRQLTDDLKNYFIFLINQFKARAS